MEQLSIPAASQAKGIITLPGSKSISNRTLLLAALANDVTEIHDLLDSDDTSRMLESLAILGVNFENIAKNTWRVTGCKGNFPNKNADLFLGNAGTAFRPLTATLAFSNGHYHLSGVPRMHERPIGDLVDALRQAGANIEYDANDGFPPLTISPTILDLIQPIQIRGDVSSQFLTALLIALPLSGQKATIEVVGELISKPYIEITLNLMAKFGVQVERQGWQQFMIASDSQYSSPETIFVEGDASSASYFLAAGAIGGDIQVDGLGKNSIQGDVRFADAIELMGGKISYGKNHIQSKKTQRIKAIELDCNHIPDAAMTLAIMALFADGTTTLRNIASWRVKETDRLTAMATELRKVGATVIEGADYLTITPPAQLRPNAVIDTYDDHRMAMCFSLVSLGGVPITINDPKCVNKTFPNYFDEFKKLVS
ncbi:AroA 5-enolpyruvylshikimate-3-phosphate synthase [Methylophilaceae bacterium]